MYFVRSLQSYIIAPLSWMDLNGEILPKHRLYTRLDRDKSKDAVRDDARYGCSIVLVAREGNHQALCHETSL